MTSGHCFLGTRYWSMTNGHIWFSRNKIKPADNRNVDKVLPKKLKPLNLLTLLFMFPLDSHFHFHTFTLSLSHSHLQKFKNETRLNLLTLLFMFLLVLRLWLLLPESIDCLKFWSWWFFLIMIVTMMTMSKHDNCKSIISCQMNATVFVSKVVKLLQKFSIYSCQITGKGLVSIVVK